MLGWFKGIASTREITFENFTLPVLTMAIYGVGYIARMTRASMVEVMTQQYIRTARLKGLGFSSVVVKHALRNALIAPFTVIMLQFPWLLTGVVIVEVMFRYQGFGYTLMEAAGNNDIDLLLGGGGPAERSGDPVRETQGGGEQSDGRGIVLPVFQERSQRLLNESGTGLRNTLDEIDRRKERCQSKQL